MDFFRYDFDYAWPWTYGHLIAAALFFLLAWLTRFIGLSRGFRVLFGLLGV